MAGQTINVSILADTKKFSSAMRNLSKETGLDKLSATFKRAGGRMVSFFKSGIKWAGALGIALAGIALKGGFTRAMNIEDAEAQLKGLGHSTKEIDSIMTNALASVKGTAFGLDEAATLAGSAVAAGIKPGQDLERQLKLVGDSAALAKTDMGEMGSIFTKVWTSGRVGTEELNQLADRGIPIWSKLAEQYDVTAEELRKMVSRGEVDAETFATVMEETVGGSALAMGDTTRGAWKNMMAAMSRAGASFLSGIFPKFKEGLTGITGFLDDIAPYAEKAGKALGDWLANVAVPAVESLVAWVKDAAAELRDRLVPAVERVGDYIEGTLVPALQDAADWFVENRQKLELIAVAIAGAVTGFMAFQKVTAIVGAVTAAVKLLNLAMLANPIGLVVAAVAALVAGLVYFFTQTETGAAMWEEIWPRIQAAAQVVSDWFTNTFLPAVQSVWEQVQIVAGQVADWFVEHVGPVITATVDLLVAVFERLLQEWQAAWDSYGAPVMVVIQAAWEQIKNATQTIWAIIQTVIETVLGVIAGVIRAVTAAIKGDWSGVWNEVKGIASTIWEGIKSTIQTAIDGVKNHISSVLDTMKSLLSIAWETIKSTAVTGWNNVKSAITDAWDRTIDAVRTKIDTVILWVKGLPGRAVSALGNIGSKLWQAGKDLIQGFIDGIKAMYKPVENALGWLTNQLPSWKGPAAKDRNLLRGAGQTVIGGFIKGMESEYGHARQSLLGFTQDVAGTRFEPFNAPVAATAGAQGGGAGAALSLDGVRIEGELTLQNGAAYVIGVLRQNKRQHAQAVAETLPMVAAIPGGSRGAGSLVMAGNHAIQKYGGR